MPEGRVMGVGVMRNVVLASACLLWLTACETTSTRLPDILAGNPPAPSVAANDMASLETTGTIPTPQPDYGPKGAPPILGIDPNDDLSVAKQHFRQENYGIAERYFRRAVEAGPNDAEAWLGLAASYDRLKRFDLADRAYEQLARLVGPTPEVLNNQGFSYILRGDYARAREILLAARAKDPANPYIKNNLELLEKSARTRKAVR
jgi:tetratricopeptide (TPR) repeat protein